MIRPQEDAFSTLILHTAALVLFPLQLLFSVFLLLRGHDEPGGGFIAGLVASGAFVLYLFAHGVASARRVIRVEPQLVLGVGLLLALGSGMVSVVLGGWAFGAQWWSLPLGPETELKLSTVLLFDIGVYFTVLGAIVTVVFSLAETED